MSATVTAALIGAIEASWHMIQTAHPDVPEVVVTLGAGTAKGGLKLGHFAADRWARGDDRIHELFVGGEGLKRGGRDVLGTLIHEAAHAAAEARSIKDTSRQGRFHNAKFKAIGEEFGLALEHSSTLGWSETTVPDATASRYARAIAKLDAALVAYRIGEIAGGGRKSSNNGVAASCECGRKIRLSKAVYGAGPIICSLCDSPFTGDDDEPEAN